MTTRPSGRLVWNEPNKNYSADALILIGYGNRIDSIQPELNGMLGRGRACVDPFFYCLGGPNGHTEREQNVVSFDVDGDYGRRGWTPNAGQYAGCVRHVQKNTVRIDLAGEAQDLELTQSSCSPWNGTNVRE